MKELSIEQKAKAYDEIIKKVNKMYHENCEACQACIEELIPELAESEDERIRKAIIEHFKWSTKQILYDYSNKKALTWLEKQGEQNLAEWNEDDEEMFNEIILDLKALKNRDTGEAGKAAYQREIDWLESLRPHSQWRPSDEQMKALDIAIRCGIQLGTWEENALKSLKEQLKKLKGNKDVVLK